MEDLKNLITEYAIPQSRLEIKVEELSKNNDMLEDMITRLRRVCNDLQQGYDISECYDGYLLD